MRKRLLGIMLITIILVQCMSIILGEVVAATIFSVTVAQVDFFDVKAQTTLSENILNVTAFDRAGIEQENTILDNNNNLNLVYYDDNYIYIQRLNSDFTTKDTLKIEKKYPKYGDITVDDNGNYYIAWGQNDSNIEDTGIVTFAISKYDNSGKFIKSFERCDSSTFGATAILFQFGNCNIDISKNGILAFNFAKQMKNGHQCNATGYVDINTMEAPEKYKAYPYTSHAFYTDVMALDSGSFIFMQQGDGYDRGYDLTLISKDDSDGHYLNHDLVSFHFREGMNRDYGYNYTFANYGGIEELDTGIALVAGSEKTLSLDPAPNYENESRNVFVQIIKESAFGRAETAADFVTTGTRTATGTQHTSDGNTEYFLEEGTTNYGVKWLTNYSGDYTAKNVKTVEVDNDRIAIFWTAAKINESVSTEDYVYYMVIDNKGNIVHDATPLEMGSLPGYGELVYKDGYVYFSNTDGTNNVRTYRVKLYQNISRTNITVPYTEKEVNTTADFKINASVNNGKTLEYKTTNSTILTVSSNGTVTPKKNGTAEVIITVKDQPRTEKRIEITVDISPTKITLDKTSLSFRPTSANQYVNVTVLPTQAEANIKWVSSNTSVAEVEQTTDITRAKIIPVGKGTCTITATVEGYPNIKAICTVTVSEMVTDIVLSDTRLELAKGEKYKLTYSVVPEEALNKQVKWTSSDESVATVDQEGVVTAISEGSTTIKAISTENSYASGYCMLDVEGNLSGDYGYELLDDGTVKILNYKGNSTTINIPSKLAGYKVTQIGDYAFAEYYAPNSTITKITIPDTVTTIERSAFAYLDALTTITIPSNVTTIRNSITRCCHKLTQINVDKNNPNFISVDGVLYTKKNNLPDILLEYPLGKKDKTYTTPESVTRIDQWAICDNTYIEEITILSNVDSFGYNSINNCDNLKRVNIISGDTFMTTTAITECDNVTIYSTEDSDAKEYAEENNIPFVVLDIKVTGLTVTPININFSSFTSQTLNVQITPNTATNRKLEYSSEDSSVASVSSSGRVTAQDNGTTRIHVKTTDGSNIEKTINVTVDVKCTSIWVSKDSVTVTGTSSSYISAFAYPSGAANRKLDYSIKDTSIATISDTGTIKGLKNGTTSIIIKTTDGSNITKEIPLTVTGLDPIIISEESVELGGVGETKRITVENSDIISSHIAIFWSSSNTKVATVNYSGLVTAVGKGTATITAKIADGTNRTATCTVTVTTPFTDIKSTDWHYPAVKEVYQKGIILGANETEFRPDKNITRGMIVTILWRMEGEPVVTGVKDFPDVNTKEYYAKAVRWATKNKVVNGYNSGKFGPNDNITREQLATILCNYAKYKGKNVNVTADTSKFNDWYKVTGYAIPSMNWAVANGVVTGKYEGTKVDPQGTASRAEAASMISKYLKNIK